MYIFLSCLLLGSKICWCLSANAQGCNIELPECSVVAEEEIQDGNSLSLVQRSGSRVERKRLEEPDKTEQEQTEGFLERFTKHIWHAFHIERREPSKVAVENLAAEEVKTSEETRKEMTKLMEAAANQSTARNDSKPDEKTAKEDAELAKDKAQKDKQEVLRREIAKLKRELHQVEEASHTKDVEWSQQDTKKLAEEFPKEEAKTKSEAKPGTVHKRTDDAAKLSDKATDAQKYSYTLTVETLTEVEQAQCIGCTDRPNECWMACGEKPGFCSACDSLRGTRGACCGQTNGTRNGDDPTECQAVDIENWKFSGYHQCVLTSKKAIYRVTDSDTDKFDKMTVFTPRSRVNVREDKADYDEEPLCQGCDGRPNECWSTCGKPGYCSACDSLWGTRGACCGIRNGTRNGDDPPECNMDTKNWKYDAYHQCVLTSSKAERQAQWNHSRPITFITVYDKFFETNLGKSSLWLHHHELPHQWMVLNNSKKIPISKLYARAQAKAANDLQVYVHPDVFLPNNFYDMFMYKLKLIEDSDPNWGVLGTAGITGGVYGPLISSITDATTGTWRSGIDSKEINALDEQLMVLRHGSPKFDPDLPGFDIYGIDIVLSAKSLGQKSYLLNVAENHKLVDADGKRFNPNDFWDKIYGAEYKARVNTTVDYFRKKWCSSGDLPITGTTFFVDCDGWKWAR